MGGGGTAGEASGGEALLDGRGGPTSGSRNGEAGTLIYALSALVRSTRGWENGQWSVSLQRRCESLAVFDETNIYLKSISQQPYPTDLQTNLSTRTGTSSYTLRSQPLRLSQYATNLSRVIFSLLVNSIPSQDMGVAPSS